jgi:hypothetical protein
MCASPRRGAIKEIDMRPKTIAAITIAIAVLVASAVAGRSNVYMVLDGGDGRVLWNANEAYLFFGVRHIGHEVNILRFPWFLAKNYLGGVEDPGDDRGSLDVIRATSSGIEHHVQSVEYSPPGSGPDMYTPLEDRIYVNYPARGGLCRWAGDHFEPATPEERQRLDNIGHLTNKDIDHGENGWSKRSFQVEPGDPNDTLTIEVSNNFRLSASDLGAKNGDRILSINLLKSGNAPEKIWEVNLHWGKVSKAEYERVFQKP